MTEAFSDTKSILKSKTVWAIVLLLLTLAAKRLGYGISEDTAGWLGTQWADIVDGIWQLGLIVAAIIGRIKATQAVVVLPPKEGGGQ